MDLKVTEREQEDSCLKYMENIDDNGGGKWKRYIKMFHEF